MSNKFIRKKTRALAASLVPLTLVFNLVPIGTVPTFAEADVENGGSAAAETSVLDEVGIEFIEGQVYKDELKDDKYVPVPLQLVKVTKNDINAEVEFAFIPEGTACKDVEEWQAEPLTATAAGTYNVGVRLKEKNGTEYSYRNKAVVVGQAEITGDDPKLSLENLGTPGSEGYTYVFPENAEKYEYTPQLKLERTPNKTRKDDVVTYRISNDGSEWKTYDENSSLKAGKYFIKAQIQRGSEKNYLVKETAPVQLSIVYPELSNLEINAVADLTYNGSEQELVKITGSPDGYSVFYSFDDGANWSEGTPKAKDAGEYRVSVKVTKAGYQDRIFNTINVSIAKKEINVEIRDIESDHDSSWNETNDGYVFFLKEEDQTVSLPWNISTTEAAGTDTSAFNISVSENIYLSVDENQIQVNASKVTDVITETVTITPTVTKESESNYDLKAKRIEVAVYPNTESVDFFVGQDDKIGEFKGGLSKVTLRIDDKSTIKTEDYGLKFYGNEIIVDNNSKLLNKLVNKEDHKIVLPVIVSYQAFGRRIYNKSVQVSVSLKNATKEMGDLYSIEGTKHTNDNKWYALNPEEANKEPNSLTFNATNGYKIAGTTGNEEQLSFDNSYVVSESKDYSENPLHLIVCSNKKDDQYYYYADSFKGRTDFDKPEILAFSLTSEPNTSKDDSQYLNQEAKFTVSAMDSTSGVAEVEYWVENSEGTKNQPQKATFIESTNSFEFTLSDEFEGKVCVRVFDGAGNSNEAIYTQTGDIPTVVVLDATSPLGWIGHVLNGENNSWNNDSQRNYTNAENVTVVFNIKEKYFEDSNPPVIMLNTHSVNIEWKKNEGAADDCYQASIDLEDEGNYDFALQFKDAAGNDMNPASDESGNNASSFKTQFDDEAKTLKAGLTIDRTAPEIQFEKPDTRFNNERKITNAKLYITDPNIDFRSIKIQDFSIKDIDGVEIEDPKYTTYIESVNDQLIVKENWNENLETHQYVFELDFKADDGTYLDGIYALEFAATDLASNGNTLGKVNKDNDEEVNEDTLFTFDTTEPVVKVKVNTKPVNIVDQSFGATMAMRYYNSLKQQDDISITVTAEDKTSGVDTVYLNLPNSVSMTSKQTGYENISSTSGNDAVDVKTSENTANSIKEVTYTIKNPGDISDIIDAVQIKTDKISAYAIDTFGYTSKPAYEDNDAALINDTIMPNLNVEYSANREDESPRFGTDKALFYNSDCVMNFTMVEDNFYPNDLKVTIYKNGEIWGTPRTLDWEHEQTANGEMPRVHTASLTIPAYENGERNDGDFQVHISYMDKSQNSMAVDNGKLTMQLDDAGSSSIAVSRNIVIDTIKPVINVTYDTNKPENTLTDPEGHTRQYYRQTRKATIQIKEHNLNLNTNINPGVEAAAMTDRLLNVIRVADANGNAISNRNISAQYLGTENDVATFVVTYPGDANYTFDIDVTDQAGNAADDYKPDYFTVDKTAPTNLSISYSKSVLDTVLEGISFGFYNAPTTVTITARDDVSSVNAFTYSYEKAAGVSDVNAELINKAISEANIQKSDGNKTATATFTIPTGPLTNRTQFNGTVNFEAKDRSNNVSTRLRDSKRIVVDNIAPNATIQFDPGEKNTVTEGQVQVDYYKQDVQMTLHIEEANFYATDVKIDFRKDGIPYPVSPNWVNASVNSHTGTFTFSEEGRYSGTITYVDKSNNAMNQLQIRDFVVDKTAPSVTLSVNGTDGRNKTFTTIEDIIPVLTVEDKNLDTNSAVSKYNRLVWDQSDTVNEKIIIDDKSAEAAMSPSGSADKYVANLTVIENKKGNDGVYTVSVQLKDKAGNTNTPADSQITFSVNRYGSVFVLGDDLREIVNQEYHKGIDQELVVKEYNPDTTVEHSISLTRDGEKVAIKEKDSATDDYTDPQNVENVFETWYGYKHTVSADVFKDSYNADSEKEEETKSEIQTETNGNTETAADGYKDGVYRMNVESMLKISDEEQRKASYVQNAADFETKDIVFKIDDTLPTITNINGLGEKSINEKEHTVSFDINDTMALGSVDINITGSNGATVNEQQTVKTENGEMITLTDFDGSLTNQTISVKLPEADANQQISVTLRDKAGNEISTQSQGKMEETEWEEINDKFNKSFVVSSDWFVRFKHNTPLVATVLAGAAVLLSGGLYLLFLKRKKDKEEEAKA